MDMGVQRTQAQGLATELLAETAWRQILESADGFAGEGIQGQMQADWLAQSLAQELAGHAAAWREGSHGGA